MTGEMVGQALDRVLNRTAGPRSITVDHGTEFQSRALEDWAYRRGVQLDFIRPGNLCDIASLLIWAVEVGAKLLRAQQETHGASPSGASGK